MRVYACSFYWALCTNSGFLRILNYWKQNALLSIAKRIGIKLGVFLLLKVLNQSQIFEYPGSHMIFIFYQSLNYQGIGAEIIKSFEMKYYDCACHTNVMNHKMTSSTFTEICVLKTKFGCKV